MLDYGDEVKLGTRELGMLLIDAKLARKHLKLINLMPVLIPLPAVKLVIEMSLLEDID